MKKLITVCTLALLTVSVFGDSKRGQGNKHEKHNYHGHHHSSHRYKPSSFDVVPLNSPVKEAVAKFLLKTPKNFDIDQVMFKVKNASELFIKDKDYSPTKLVNGKELHIPVSSLRNGFYRLFVRVKTIEKAKPRNKYHDHDYKSSYHDYVRFVIGRKSTEVPMPDPIKNSATLLGVDTDNDGVRDDIQIWINQKTSNEKARLAMKQIALAKTKSYFNKDNKELSISATFDLLRAQDCHRFIQHGLGTTRKDIKNIHREIEAMFLNTKERIDASYKVNDNFHGQLIERTEAEIACDF